MLPKKWTNFIIFKYVLHFKYTFLSTSYELSKLCTLIDIRFFIIWMFNIGIMQSKTQTACAFRVKALL